MSECSLCLHRCTSASTANVTKSSSSLQIYFDLSDGCPNAGVDSNEPLSPLIITVIVIVSVVVVGLMIGFIVYFFKRQKMEQVAFESLEARTAKGLRLDAGASQTPYVRSGKTPEIL